MLTAKILALFLGFVSLVSAHGSGSEYLEIEGETALPNPILSYAQPTQLKLGEDIAPSPGYLVGTALTFDIDFEIFPVAANTPPPQFRWDFGDGSEPQVGVTATHTYKNPGTYIIDLKADLETVNTIQIDILPSAIYQKIQPKILINDTRVENSARDVTPIAPAKPVEFIAQASGSAGLEYFWDFGNEQGAQGQTATTRYSRDDYFPVVVLRTIDENGLWSDTYALLDLPVGSSNPFARIWYMIVDFVTSLVARS